MHNSELTLCIEKLVGRQKCKTLWLTGNAKLSFLDIGHSQFNEILISYDCKTTQKWFFNEFWGDKIEDLQHFKEGIDNFRKASLLLYGNVAFGYKKLNSMSKQDFSETLENLNPIPSESYKNRHHPIYKIDKINGDDTRFNGYLLEEEIKKKLTIDPNDHYLKQLKEKSQKIHNTAEYNHNAYLCSDHMDVYVATSMRKAHEFTLVSDFCNRIFSEADLLKNLNIRWFDPTQARCKDRIDKGLSEALMLKRSKCTIYLIQESDTLGKASEMASTLAQGKTVIAYVPSANSDNKDRWMNWFKTYSEKPIFKDFDQGKILKSLAETYCINEILNTENDYDKQTDIDFRNWFFGPQDSMDIDKIVSYITDCASKVWDKRASTLIDKHPLGIQVNLDTGVANGVLVARDEDTCIKLIQRVLLNKMEFHVEDSNGYVFLREKLTNCIYRVSSNDPVLVNSFWNYYLP